MQALEQQCLMQSGNNGIGNALALPGGLADLARAGGMMLLGQHANRKADQSE